MVHHPGSGMGFYRVGKSRFSVAISLDVPDQTPQRGASTWKAEGSPEIDAGMTITKLDRALLLIPTYGFIWTHQYLGGPPVWMERNPQQPCLLVCLLACSLPLSLSLFIYLFFFYFFIFERIRDSSGDSIKNGPTRLSILTQGTSIF